LGQGKAKHPLFHSNGRIVCRILTVTKALSRAEFSRINKKMAENSGAARRRDGYAGYAAIISDRRRE